MPSHNQQDLFHDPIPLFEVALKGIESGYRQCFRTLHTELSKYQPLCETYEPLSVDTSSGKSVNGIFKELKSGREVKGKKSKARDAAFKLLYLILLWQSQHELKDSAKIFDTYAALLLSYCEAEIHSNSSVI